MLPFRTMVVVREYVDEAGYSPFGAWFGSLEGPAAVKVTAALARVAQGPTCAVKACGGGMYEAKVYCGRGSRFYFGKDGERLVILVGGGIKKRQQRDIASAKAIWN